MNFAKEDSARQFAEFFLGEWLRCEFGLPIGATMPELDVTREADDSWAWSIKNSELEDGCEDTTSYLGLDMFVMWNGTTWSPEPTPDDGLDPIRECLEQTQARAAALRAIALDPDNSDPRRASGQAWAFAEVAEELSAALALAEACTEGKLSAVREVLAKLVKAGLDDSDDAGGICRLYGEELAAALGDAPEEK